MVRDFFRKIKKKNCSFRLIKIKKNSGKGYALKKGCLIAKNDWILTTDLDFSVPLDYIIYWFKNKLITDEFVLFRIQSSKKSGKNRKASIICRKNI